MKQHGEAFLQLAMAAKACIEEIEPEALSTLIEGGVGYTLIDVREDHEWATGGIPTAVHLGRGIIERDIEKQVPDKATPIILYCSGGFRSALAAQNLMTMGYQNVKSLKGGKSAFDMARGQA